MPGDLVSGRYPLVASFSKLVGLASNAAQSNLAVRSNKEWFGLADLTDAAASLVSGEMTVVPVPVAVGDQFSTVAVAVGATDASTPTHSWAQLYTGVLTTAKPIGTQSADGTTAAIAASGLFKFTLGSSVIITPDLAPYGYIYVGVSVTGSGVPSLVGGNVATAAQYARFADDPIFAAGTIGSALGATAPTSITLSSVTAIATVPEVYLY